MLLLLLSLRVNQSLELLRREKSLASPHAFSHNRSYKFHRVLKHDLTPTHSNRVSSSHWASSTHVAPASTCRTLKWLERIIGTVTGDADVTKYLFLFLTACISHTQDFTGLLPIQERQQLCCCINLCINQGVDERHICYLILIPSIRWERDIPKVCIIGFWVMVGSNTTHMLTDHTVCIWSSACLKSLWKSSKSGINLIFLICFSTNVLIWCQDKVKVITWDIRE